MDVRVGPCRKLSIKELLLLNCGVGEYSWESLGLMLLLSHFSHADSMQPHWQQPTRLPCPWDSPGKNTGVGCHFLLQCVKVKLLSRVPRLVTPWTAAYEAPPSMGFSRRVLEWGAIAPGLKGNGNQSWIFIGRTDAECEAPIFWLPDAKYQLIGKKPCCWENLKARGKGDNRRWDGWMTLLTQWTWVWANSGR